MKTIAIVQARINSKRFPKKVLKKINEVTLIEILLYRLSKAKEIDEIVLATTKNKSDDVLCKLVNSLGYKFYRGSEKNVLLRYIQAADYFNGKNIVRITGDCPLVDPKLVDNCIRNFKKTGVDYYTNTNPPTFPDGLDVEIVKLKALKKINKLKLQKNYREHVTNFFRKNNNFTKGNLLNYKDFSNIRWTIDEEKDLLLIKKIFKLLKYKFDASWREILNLRNKKKNIFNINKSIKRNEGEKLTDSKKLWLRANSIIPGGNMLLSKNPELYCENWPAYYKKAKGCEIVDYNNKRYLDFSSMGVGTNILGYCNKEVDEAVIRSIKKSNMSTLNCPEEVDLADKLLELHPWAGMVKFARTGGEANSIAIRIARAATGKDKIAVCGYHGWHDWYLSANLKKKKNLDNHLIPGLSTFGVPKNLKDTVYTFNYNDFKTLENLCNKENIGIIKMEVIRNNFPKENFLTKVRNLCDRKNILLIFDECTTGFRENLGGIHLKFNVIPDLSIFGKALGNGYAITAVLGKKNIMKYADKTFISSTFWTERIGPTAGLKTIDIMKKKNSWEKITNIGEYIQNSWKKISKEIGLEIKINGIPSLSSFNFLSKNNQKYKIFISQEMLKKGYLASNSIYVCTEHKKHLVDEYIYNLEKIFKIIKQCEDGRDINKLVKYKKLKKSFGRLN